VFDVPGCGLRIDTGLPKGFSLTRHEVVLYGSCSECA
jgi:Fe2+ or Zn2+ uptake regulation protein